MGLLPHYCFLLVFGMCLAGLAQPDKAAPRTGILVELVDGTRVAGTWVDDTIELQIPGSPPMKAKASSIWRLERKTPTRMAIQLTNGDNLWARLPAKHLNLKSSLGELRLPMDKIARLRVDVLHPVLEFDHRFASEGGRIDFGPVPALNKASQFTFAGWFFSTRLPGHQGLFAAKQDDLHIVRAHFWHNNRLYVHVTSGQIGYVSFDSAELNPDEWFHVAIVFDGEQAAANRVTAYFNGKPKKGKVTGSIPARTPNLGKAGLIVPPKQFGFNGRIRLVQVFDRALTAPEITQLSQRR